MSKQAILDHLANLEAELDATVAAGSGKVVYQHADGELTDGPVVDGDYSDVAGTPLYDAARVETIKAHLATVGAFVADLRDDNVPAGAPPKRRGA